MRYRRLVKKVLVTVLIGTMAFGASGCDAENKANTDKKETNSVSKDSDKEDTTDLETVVIGVPQVGDQLGMELGNVAVQEGFLEEELNAIGYTADVQGFAGAGPEINEAFASGSIDIAVYGDFPTITCRSNGVDTVVIGAANHLQQYGILARNDSGVEEVKDIEGKVAAVMQGTSAQYSWNSFVKQNGLDMQQIEVVNATPVDSVSMLQSGDIDIFPTTLYNAVFLAEQGAGSIIATSIDNPESGSQFFVVADGKYISENEKVGVAIEKALIRSQEYVKENPDVLYEALSSESYSAEIMKTAYDFDETFAYLNPGMTEEDVKKLQSVIDFMKDNGIISESLVAESIVDNTYYEKAVEELEK